MKIKTATLTREEMARLKVENYDLSAMAAFSWYAAGRHWSGGNIEAIHSAFNSVIEIHNDWFTFFKAALEAEA